MKIKGVGRGILVLVGLALLVLVLGARPPEPTPTPLTQLGVKPSDMVTLRGVTEYDGSVAFGKFIRVYSDGTTQ